MYTMININGDRYTVKIGGEACKKMIKTLNEEVQSGTDRIVKLEIRNGVLYVYTEEYLKAGEQL